MSRTWKVLIFVVLNPREKMNQCTKKTTNPVPVAFNTNELNLKSIFGGATFPYTSVSYSDVRLRLSSRASPKPTTQSPPGKHIIIIKLVGTTNEITFCRKQAVGVECDDAAISLLLIDSLRCSLDDGKSTLI